MFGTGQLISPKLIEIVGEHGGFDALWLDAEHAGLTMKEIGKILDLTESRVCQIHSNVILRLKDQATRKLGKRPTDGELHALRIRAKRARYTAELAAVGSESKALSRYLVQLKALQDVIGDHQDAVVAEEKIRAVARAKTAIAAGRLIERERERRRERRRDYPPALARVLRRGSKALG